MTLLAFAVPGLTGGACAILVGMICLLIVRRQRTALKQTCQDLRSELQSLVREHRVECTEQMAQLGCSIALLESGVRSIDAAGNGGLTRSLRSQAMQLLRSGASPESAASTLGIGKREMRLIARVSSALSLK